MHALRRRLVFLVVFTAAVLAIAQAAHAHGTDDRSAHFNSSSNQVSVKVDDDAIDDGPANHPHTICGMSVVVEHGFGRAFDMDFDAQAPTTRAGDDQHLLIVHVPDGDDVSGIIDLRAFLGGIVADPHQGFHISITAHLPDGDKHKVIWTQLCPPTQQQASTTTTMHGTTTTTSHNGTTSTTANTTTSTTAVAGAVTNPTVPTQVLGENFTKPAAAAAESTTLANTGMPFPPALAVGLVFGGLIVLGAARHASGRRLELSMRRVDDREL